MVYYIRSCDYIRHFRDDIYMACRKLMWVLDILKKRDPVRWNNVKPGYFAMHITSLHCFNKEKEILKQKNQDNKNKKKDDQDKLNGIDSDLVLQDIGIEEHRNSNHERNNKGDVFEEIPIKKESFLKKIFKKHPNKKQSDTNELDSNEVFDETGSTLDDMQNLSMNDLDLDNGLFNDNNSKNRRIC